MKGIVFTEFSEMIVGMFGDDMLDDLIDETKPASGGAYTAVGTYDHQELLNMVVELSHRTGIEVPKLVHTFGLHLGKTFTEKFTTFFVESGSTLKFLRKIDNHIHVEVRKLYPDAELPVFSFKEPTDDEPAFKLHYQSTRGLAELAHGLIEATSAYYGEKFDIKRDEWQEGDVHHCVFSLALTASK